VKEVMERVSKNGLLVLTTIAAAAAAFFLVVPLARHFAEQQLGWNQSGQEALAKIVFFPVLLLALYVLRTLGTQKQDRPPE
jgi:hypothetical protein